MKLIWNSRVPVYINKTQKVKTILRIKYHNGALHILPMFPDGKFIFLSLGSRPLAKENERKAIMSFLLAAYVKKKPFDDECNCELPGITLLNVFLNSFYG